MEGTIYCLCALAAIIILILFSVIVSNDSKKDLNS